MHYNTADFARRYASGRRTSTESMEMWVDAVAAHIKDRPPRIIDAGCGTGRFTSALAERFQAFVLGLDPSLAMLLAAIDHAISRGALRGPVLEPIDLFTFAA